MAIVDNILCIWNGKYKLYFLLLGLSKLSVLKLEY